MSRTRHIKSTGINTLVSALIARASLAAKLGKQFDGNRDLYTALGYKRILTFGDFYAQYVRQDIAKAVIDRPVTATWRGKLKIQESKTQEDTKFETEWVKLERKLKIMSKFRNVDKLCCLGKYAVLLMGLDDVRTLEDNAKPISTGKRQIKYIKAFAEPSIEIKEIDKNPNSERYGFPLLYTLKIKLDEITDTEQTVTVHHSRILHIVYDTLDSEVEGIPVLEAIFNRLMDLEKIVGGDGEMFWKGARPGYSGKVNKDFQLTPDEEAALEDQITEYEHGLRRFLIAEGLDLSELGQQLADPSKHVDVQVQMISAKTQIPKRILLGSERGELASSQDSDEWREYVQTRREEHAEEHIIKPFIDFCIQHGILPKPKTEEYAIIWNDLFTRTEKEKTEIGKNRATALREYMTSPAVASVVTPKAFMRYFLGLEEEDIELIEQLSEGEVNSELSSLDKITPEQQQMFEEDHGGNN